MRHRGVLGVVATTLLVLLAGCGSPPEPGTIESDKGQTSAAPAPSPSPSPTATASNGTADEKKGSTEEKLDAAGKAEVERTVSAYLQALDNAYKTGKTADVRKLTHDKCRSCIAVLAHIDDVYGKGGRIEGCQAGEPEGVTVGEVVVLAGTVRQVNYSAKISATECKNLSKSGSVLGREPALAGANMQFTLEQVGEEWKVRTWELG